MTCAFRRFGVVLSVIALALLAAVATPNASAGSARAGIGDAQPAPSFAIRAGRVLTAAAEGPIEYAPGVIVVRDGVIESVGDRFTEIPRGMRVLDLSDATVVPGFVAASSGIVPRRRGVESVSAAYLAVDAHDPYADHRPLLAEGITTAHLGPGNHKLVSGQGAVVKLAGSDRVLNARADLSVNLRDEVDTPPRVERVLLIPSPDNEIKPSEPQRPGGRMTRLLGIDEALEASGDGSGWHERALAAAWDADRPLRVRADRAVDLNQAITLIERHDRDGYLVGGTEAAKLAEKIERARLGLVYTLRPGFDGVEDLGDDPDALEQDLRDLAAFEDLDLALTLDEREPLAMLRLAASMALRSGINEARALAAITRVPAELMGVSDRVGSIEAGKDADLVVFNGTPFDAASRPIHTFARGEHAWGLDDDPSSSGPVVIRAERVWIGPGNELANGELLIEDGKITSVGPRVARPRGARLIDGGPGSFATPGFIDAFGHLGLMGDENSPGAGVSLSRLLGPDREHERRVAAAGVTTVVQSPYRFSGSGSRLSAVKTSGPDRESRLVDDAAALGFDVRSLDPDDIAGRLKPRIEAGQKYVAKWTEYQTKLDEWKQARSSGEATESEVQVEEIEDEGSGPDPLTGTWQVSLVGDMLPDAIEGPVGINLDGTEFEGRVLHPRAAEIDHRIYGTLEDNLVSGTLEIDTGGQGYPTFEAELDGESMEGTLTFLGIQLEMTATRTSSDRVEFSLGPRKRRTTGKDGRPLPPKTEPDLEPMRAVLEGSATVAIRAGSAQQIDAALGVLRDEFDLPVVLIANEGFTGVRAASLAAKKVGVVAPRQIARSGWVGDEYRAELVPVLELRDAGVHAALGSRAEDGARSLPAAALYAVSLGLGPDEALALLTSDAAKIFKIDDRVGSLEEGRDGDVLLFKGHPMDPGSSLERVFITGREVKP
ncbi:MAG: amidohydrolase family protein [Planctomycetota bacterium]